jgi:hypothetical protein
MKDFNKFLEEITIKGNTGIPGEADKSGNKYLSDVEKRAKSRLGVRGNESPRDIGGILMEIMGLVQKSLSFTSGKEKELEELAEEVIRSEYGDILGDTYLDIKMLKPGQVKSFMDEESEDDEMDKPTQIELKDPKIKLEVDKFKIANNVIQGEGKNTKHMLHLQIVKDGLSKIFGEEKSKEIFNIWDKISKIADKLDWVIPINIKADMIQNQPEGLAGAVKVDWTKKKSEKRESTVLADDILKSLENGDFGENEEEVEELLDGCSTVIKARGINFPMLLHETIKGIYELIASVGISDDKRTAELVKLNVTSFEDEAEDFRYGPEIASDIRAFISLNNDIDKYPNIPEFVFGQMMILPAEEFLELVHGILSKTDKARRDIDLIIHDIIKEIDKYEIENLDIDSEESNDLDTIVNKEVSYSDMSNSDIIKEMDDALDNGDIERYEYLQTFLKENMGLYSMDYKMITEGINPHKR